MASKEQYSTRLHVLYIIQVPSLHSIQFKLLITKRIKLMLMDPYPFFIQAQIQIDYIHNCVMIFIVDLEVALKLSVSLVTMDS